MKNLTKFAAIAAIIFGFGASQAAAEFPDRQITMIVPFGAGGGSDRVARMVDQFWQETTGESFNFQYQPGASGAVGTAAISRAKADGYTVGIVNMPNLVVQPVSGTATFALDSFDYIGAVNYDPMVLMVPEHSPFNTLEEFIAAAKEAPKTFTIAITGSLSVGHIGALEFMESAGIEVTLVPTQGGANTVARVAGGHVSAGIIGLGLFSTQESGRALGVTSEQRSEFAPDVPTFAEKGMPIVAAVQRVIVAPAGLPADAKTYLRNNLKAVAESRGFIEASAAQGLGAAWQNGDDLSETVFSMQDSITELLTKFDLLD
ncbi:MAG: Bug family tripartite tricarboxylate transporter substrate binding protein [Planctomycetota bacterium]|jgi:tripartite-type tricarboxylate transporter receptor subunit TctC